MRCNFDKTSQDYNLKTNNRKQTHTYGNLLSFLLRSGTRPYERGTQ